MKYLHVKNYSKYQTETGDGPKKEWVKLYQSLFSDYAFVTMTDADKVVYIGCLLLAARVSPVNNIPFDPVYLGRQLMRDPVEVLGLIQTGFLILTDEIVIEELQPRMGRPPGSKTKTKTTKKEKAPKDDPAFEQIWTVYPKRSGDNPKRDALKAYHATVTRGVLPEQLAKAVKGYRDYLAAHGKIGTEYVKMASTFFGPAEPWREYAAKAEEKPRSLYFHEDDPHFGQGK